LNTIKVNVDLKVVYLLIFINGMKISKIIIGKTKINYDILITSTDSGMKYFFNFYHLTIMFDTFVSREI
jgi:hypothetical protein